MTFQTAIVVGIPWKARSRNLHIIILSLSVGEWKHGRDMLILSPKCRCYEVLLNLIHMLARQVLAFTNIPQIMMQPKLTINL